MLQFTSRYYFHKPYRKQSLDLYENNLILHFTARRAGDFLSNFAVEQIPPDSRKHRRARMKKSKWKKKNGNFQKLQRTTKKNFTTPKFFSKFFQTTPSAYFAFDISFRERLSAPSFFSFLFLEDFFLLVFWKKKRSHWYAKCAPSEGEKTYYINDISPFRNPADCLHYDIWRSIILFWQFEIICTISKL